MPLKDSNLCKVHDDRWVKLGQIFLITIFPVFFQCRTERKTISQVNYFFRRDRCLSNHSKPLWTGSHYESRDRNIVSSAYFQIDFASERFEGEIFQGDIFTQRNIQRSSTP